MKNKVILVALAVCGLQFSTIASASESVHWTYSGNEGPEYWGELSENFQMCSTGKNQSPINLTDMLNTKLPKLKMDYKSGGNEVINNGHTIQVNYKAGSTLVVDDHEFELKQFHFHVPSENRINGNSFPMEAHLVHADKDGNLAVVALMFKLGKENAVLANAWASMPENAGGKEMLASAINVEELLPKHSSYYRFNGSLTTPPCSEGVQWIVMKDAVTVSQEQVDQFSHTIHHPNNRPIQPVNARIILK